MSQPDMFDEVMKKAREITGAPEPDAHWSDLLADSPPAPAQTAEQAVSEIMQKNQIDIEAKVSPADEEAILRVSMLEGPVIGVKIITTDSLIESAEILKRALVEAENAFEAEMKPMRAKLKEAEDALRAKALEQGEPIKGAHIQVQIVAPSATVKWDDKGLSGAVAMLPAEWRQAILAHRKTDEKPASTRIVYK